MRKAELEKICNRMIGKWEREKGLTFCNKAVKEIALAWKCATFKESDYANDMVETMRTNPEWQIASAERAHRHAKRGGLAVAAKQDHPHGHVSVIYPEETMFYSPSWKRLVPYLANVGWDNGIMPTSQAFAVAKGEPEYFIWGTV